MDYVEITGRVVKTTDGACLFEMDDYEPDESTIWIPWSQIEENGESMHEGWSGRIYIARWFAEKEGLDIEE